MITIRSWDIGVIVFVTICKEKQPLHIGYNIMLQQGQNRRLLLKSLSEENVNIFHKISISIARIFWYILAVPH
jgi:hypothetical protein